MLRGVVDSGLPLVLKPRRGTSSQDTELISDEEQLRAAVAVSEPGRMLLEGYIPDPTMPQTGAGSASYVSVELISSSGMVDVLGMSSRTPLAPPLRETGFLLPADGALAADLAAAAVQAVQALGVEIRALHVELKCTDDGPVIIEVNARPGGAGVHFRMRRALGIDTVQPVMRLTVGEEPMLGDLPVPDGVVFRFDVQPDANIRRITAVDRLNAVLHSPGVEQVVPRVGRRDDFSWRNGTLGFAAAVIGTAPHHQTARRIRDDVLDCVAISGTQ